MAARTLLFIISLVYLTEFILAFSLQHVMARLNALEVKFDMLDLENKLRRSETEELFRRVSEVSSSGKMITASEHVSRNAPSDYGEHVSPKETVAPLDRTTILPHKDINKTSESALELQKLKYYLTEGAKVEKDKNQKLRTELKDIGNMLKADYAELESNIKEEVKNLTNNLSENQKSLEIDYASFTSNIMDNFNNFKHDISEGAKVEKDKNQKLRTELKDIGNMLKADYAELKSNIKEEVKNLTNNLSENQKSLEIDYASFKSNIMDNFNNFKHDISENQKSLVSVERFDNFKDFVTTALAIASNNSKQAIISLKSDFEMSISKISNNVSIVSKTLANINNRQTELELSMQELSNGFNSMNKTLNNITIIQSEFKSTTQKPVHSPPKTMRSCRNSPHSGVYDIYLDEKSVSSVRVYCDQTTDGGGWIVFQRRQDGSVDFERTWADYKTGFGNLEGEFWLGNDNLHALTSAGFNELRIDLEDFEGNRRYAKYSHFKVKSENEKYELEVSGYSGDAGDSLTSRHNGMSFSTKDRDNDLWEYSCSVIFRGAWWYDDCHQSNLNGFYYSGANSPNSRGGKLVCL